MVVSRRVDIKVMVIIINGILFSNKDKWVI